MLKKSFEAAVRIERKMHVIDRLMAKTVIFAVKHPVATLGGGLVLKEVLFGGSPGREAGGSRSVPQPGADEHSVTLQEPIESDHFRLDPQIDYPADEAHFIMEDPVYHTSEARR
jgi:hypothetical protein